MNDKKTFIVTDLGGGDGGKGGVVHKICVDQKAHTVIKIGGAQGSHGVRTKSGHSFNFSQFGCGTFEGSKTHLSNLMLIEPYRLLQEANELKFRWGIRNIFDQLTIDEDCLCITPFQTFASRLKELHRQNNPKGTVGIGGGETIIDAENYPELSIRAKDLKQNGLEEKLKEIQRLKIVELEEITDSPENFLNADQKMAADLINLLRDENVAIAAAKNFRQLSEEATIVSRDHCQKILKQSGVIVVESSHGILTDRYYGFHPHTTRLRTTPFGVIEMMQELGYDGKIIKIGVSRAYQIRHGAGPMVTESPEMTDRLLPGSNKGENRWQGKVRVGPLDLVSLKYALEVCGNKFFDGLAITWLDQIQSSGQWSIAEKYTNTKGQEFFNPDGTIRVIRQEGLEQLIHQEKLGNLLSKCQPVITTFDVSGYSQGDLINLVTGTLKDKLQTPIVMVGLGPTEDKKICFKA